jgi:hypothetical protein
MQRHISLGFPYFEDVIPPGFPVSSIEFLNRDNSHSCPPCWRINSTASTTGLGVADDPLMRVKSAKRIGVMPLLSLALTSAPWASSHSTMSLQFFLSCGGIAASKMDPAAVARMKETDGRAMKKAAMRLVFDLLISVGNNLTRHLVRMQQWFLCAHRFKLELQSHKRLFAFND